MFEVIYHSEPLPPIAPLLYFAGPTRFTDGKPNWHTAGLAHLEKRCFEGVVALPVPRDGVWRGDEEEQIQWQLLAQGVARRIVLWAPWDGEVTKIEFGQWYTTGKLVAGILSNSSVADYMRMCAKMYGVPTDNRLEGVIDLALAKL